VVTHAASSRPGDPLAGRYWGSYDGPRDEVYPAYRAATGTTKKLLARVALRPRVKWLGPWNGNADVASFVHDYIRNVTRGHPGALVQLAIFRLKPWEGAACNSLPTSAEQASYRQWINRVAGAIGATHVALVLQPDLPFAMCAPHHSTIPLQLVDYAARKFGALRNTSVYIDVGAADWPTVAQATRLLRLAGVAHARGFALNATHYDSIARQIAYGAKVVTALRNAGIPGRHFVISTAQNGRPFTHWQYHGSDFNRAETCRTRSSLRCATLGIPPTWHVDDPRLHLTAQARNTALRLVDAYLWIGRPWLEGTHFSFDKNRTLALARTTPFA
jgi:hypothetical protein